jgi:hypothetical protein
MLSPHQNCRDKRLILSSLAKLCTRGLQRFPLVVSGSYIQNIGATQRAISQRERCRIISAFMHNAAKVILLGLQCLVVLFVALHNWIPLGKLNDMRGVRQEFPGRKLLITTLINFTPYAFGLVASALYFERAFPGWLFWWLWISYGLAVYGSLKAWWIPYLWRPNPTLAERYWVMHGATHTFLPERNGIRPNTLHVMFDVMIVAILIVLGVLTARNG